MKKSKGLVIIEYILLIALAIVVYKAAEGAFKDKMEKTTNKAFQKIDDALQ